MRPVFYMHYYRASISDAW